MDPGPSELVAELPGAGHLRSMSLPLPMDTLPPGARLGAVRIPGSKSVSNRALLLGALAPGTTSLRGGLEAEDTRWMRAALRALGLRLDEEDGTWVVGGGIRPTAQEPLWLGASGTTLRFLLPWLALFAQGPLRLEGDPRLFERPLEPLVAPLRAMGARWEPEGQGGRLHPCPAPPSALDLDVDARLSSQFLTGLALAAAALPGGGELRWGGTSSESYLELTAHWMRAFGCETSLSGASWTIPGGRLRPADLELPADWSGAAAFLAAGAVTGREVEVHPLDTEDPQGDRAMVSILTRAGCTVAWPEPRRLRLKGPLRRGLEADLTLCPDLGPVLAAVGALAPGPSVLTGLHTLPLKECDRLQASAELVAWLGGEAEVEGDHTLRIRPGRSIGERGPFDPLNDHRMAFAAAVGALRRGGDLLTPHCVAKTYPLFWEAWTGMLAGSGP